MSDVLDSDETGVARDAASEPSLARQRSLWLSQASTVPNLQCGKDKMFPRTLELLRQIRDGEAVDLASSPALQTGDASFTWQQFAAQLRAMGLVENRRGVLHLTADGEALVTDESMERLATLLAARVRLFAEVLGLIVEKSRTVQGAHAELVDAYGLDWKSPNNTRVRLTWLEVLGCVEWLGGNNLAATPVGRELFKTWETVDPAAVTLEDVGEPHSIPPAPTEIAALLERLATGAAKHDARKTYNIWVPSPSSDPNKIENMRTSVAAAQEPIDKEELLSFIAQRFGLKRSSVESMLPFMRAGGFLQEVRRGVFVATPAAKAWLASSSDIDFIRVLHANMRFVGELVRAARENTTRSEVYREGSLYGMNQDKIRWLIAFMIEAGLLIDTSWSSVEATPTGRQLLTSLPLAAPPSGGPKEQQTPPNVEARVGEAAGTPPEDSEATMIASALVRTARDPAADGKGSGVAFETAIEAAFQRMGFRAERISGAGDTDVLVQWYGPDQVLRTAIVDAKSSSSGQVTHTGVSDVAITTHKDKHGAQYVALVAPTFAGDTIREMAVKKRWALISAAELGDVVIAADSLGLRPSDVGELFEVPDGLAKVAALIEARQREVALISLVISRLRDEVENDEAMSPRDLSLMERRSGLAPTIDELMAVFELLVRVDGDIVRVVDESADPRHVTYQVGDVRTAANRLRALALALESGLEPESA